MAAAFVLTAAVKPRESDSDRKLADAQKVIDRLLTFVPARAEKLSNSRLAGIVDHLSAQMTAVFAGASRVLAIVTDEADLETEACQVITLRADLAEGTSGEAIALGIRAIHRSLAQVATTDELRALTLLVEPQIQP